MIHWNRDNERLLFLYLGALVEIGEANMSALDDLKAAVAGLESEESAAIALLADLSAKLAALVAAGGTSVAAADVQAIVTQLNQDTANLTAAVTANTPAP